MKRSLIVLILLISAIGIAQTSNGPRPFWFDFSGGLNLRDSEVALGIAGQTPSHVVGNSYNYTYHSDGTARKAKGVSKDTIGVVAADTAINFMRWLPIDPQNSGPGRVLVHAGTTWVERVTDGTAASSAYSRLTVTSELAGYDTLYIGSDLYGTELFVTGADIPLARYDASGLYRVRIEDIYDVSRASADTVAYDARTGLLDTSETYYYSCSYLVDFPNNQGFPQEGPRSESVSATTSDGVGADPGKSRMIAYSLIPRQPASIGTEPDSSQIVGINIYRSTNDADFYWLATIPAADTSFRDEGILSVDLTKQAIEQQVYPDSILDVEAYNDILFFTGSIQDAPWQQRTRLHGKTAVTGGYRYTVGQWGDADGSMTVDSNDVYYILRYSVGYTEAGFRFENADVTASGSVTGLDASQVMEYLEGTRTPSWDAEVEPLLGAGLRAHSVLLSGTDETISRVIQTVNSDTTFSILGDSLADLQFVTSYYTIAPSKVAHKGIFYTENSNPPIVMNWDAPYNPMSRQGQIRRLLSMPASLYVFGQHGIWQLLFEEYADESYIRSVLPTGGLVGPAAATTYRGGAVYVDDDGGLYYLQSAYSPQRLSEILSTAILDSVSDGFLDDIIVTEHNDKVYVAARSGDGSDVWIYDATNGTWARRVGWHVGAFGTWATNDGLPEELFYGDYRKGNIYKIDDSRSADVDLSGADSSITAEIFTPRFHFGTDDAVWEELHLVMDTNNKVRVSFEIGAFDSTFTVTPDSILLADSSMTSGIPKVYILPINAIGHTCQVQIWTTGTGRNTIYPSRILASQKEF